MSSSRWLIQRLGREEFGQEEHTREHYTLPLVTGSRTQKGSAEEGLIKTEEATVNTEFPSKNLSKEPRRQSLC